MNPFKQAKQQYDNIPVPPELPEHIRAGIREGTRRRGRHVRAARRWIAAAACFVLILTGLNVSPTLASAASKVPVLGGVFRILCCTDFHEAQDGIQYDVSAPQIEADSTLAERINAAIQEKVDLHLAKAQQDWDAYRDAFLATGGTQAQWEEKEMDVLIDYEIHSQTDSQVSFTVTFAEGWVSSYEERHYYNLDLADGRELTLQDVLGENWIAICNEAIEAQIAQSPDADAFFSPEKGGFTTVDETTGFYIRQDGTVVVCFPKYAIAAGTAGNPEFSIARP